MGSSRAKFTPSKSPVGEKEYGEGAERRATKCRVPPVESVDVGWNRLAASSPAVNLKFQRTVRRHCPPYVTKPDAPGAKHTATETAPTRPAVLGGSAEPLGQLRDNAELPLCSLDKGRRIGHYERLRRL